MLQTMELTRDAHVGPRIYTEPYELTMILNYNRKEQWNRVKEKQPNRALR